jgi:hypothetical protein
MIGIRKKLLNKLSRLGMGLSLAALLVVPQMGHSEAISEDPSAMAMTGDLLIARPILLATTVVGSLIYIVSLPLSLAGGNAISAADTLVVGPAKATFMRCLGCTHSGYSKGISSTEE